MSQVGVILEKKKRRKGKLELRRKLGKKKEMMSMSTTR